MIAGRRRKRQAAARVAFLLLWAALAVVPPPAAGQASTWATVTAVLDGDTIRVGSGRTVRLIGVDTPEEARRGRPAEPYAAEATAFTRRMLLGRRVRLEVPPEDPVDAYGRTLAYVFLEDGTLFNRELVRAGYARAYRRFPFAYREEFLRLEAEARAAGRGLWGAVARAPSGPPAGPIIGNVRSRVYHVPGQRTYGTVAPRNRAYFESEAEAIRQGYRRARD